MAIISGASHALNYKAKHPRSTDTEVLQYVNKDIEEILEKIDKEN